jgi:valyl-tRNA synthetase
MSKSKGNVIDPLDIVDGIELQALIAKRTRGLMQPQLAPSIEQATRATYPHGIAAHGADALRFTFAALASANRDIRFDLQRVAGYRNFCNKLWNAARFVTLVVPDASAADGAPGELSIADRWIRSRFGRCLEKVHGAIAGYRFDYMAAALYEFTWDEFCSWYVELTKPILQSADCTAAAKCGTQQTLAQLLEALQRALHPLMPFITEEIWQRTAALAGRGGATIMLEPYPAAADFPQDPHAESEVAWLQKFILAVRQIRGEMDINPSKRIPVLVKEPGERDRASIERHRSYLERLAGIESITLLERGASPPQAATALVGELTLLVPMANLIDAAAESERLDKRLAKTRRDLEKTHAQLGNEDFVGNAPAAVVAALRERAAELERTAHGLEAQLKRIRALQSA